MGVSPYKAKSNTLKGRGTTSQTRFLNVLVWVNEIPSEYFLLRNSKAVVDLFVK